jgi:hypothetical protein
MAKLVKAGVTLRDQVDAKWINRDKSSDGWIGNSEHAARASFHNPDKRGWVFALDIDENFGVGKWRNGGTAKRFANELIAYSRSTLPGHDRVLHVVYEDQVASGTYKAKASFWKFRGRGYSHFQHIHITFTEAAVKNGALFPLPCLALSAQAKKDWTARLAPWL